MMRAHNTNVLMLDEIVQIMVMIISDAILVRCLLYICEHLTYKLVDMALQCTVA